MLDTASRRVLSRARGEDRMKKPATAIGILGVLVTLWAVVGRFHKADTVMLGDYQFAAGSILLAGCAVMLVAVLLGVLGLYEKK